MKVDIKYTIAAALIGALVTYLFLPSKTKKVIVKEEVIKEVEVEKEIEVVKEVVKEVEKLVKVSEKKTKREVIKPDGTVIREEIYESNHEQLERLAVQERERANAFIREKENALIAKYSKTVTKTNPKKFNLGMGYNPLSSSYSGYFNGTLLGPFTAGIIITDNNFYPTIGMRF